MTMTRDRAIEVLRWGHCYARPKLKPNEKRDALRYMRSNPETSHHLGWPQPPEEKKR